MSHFSRNEWEWMKRAFLGVSYLIVVANKAEFQDNIDVQRVTTSLKNIGCILRPS